MLRKSLVLMVVAISLSAAAANATVISLNTLNNQATEPTLSSSGVLDLALNFTPTAGTLTRQGITFTNVTATADPGPGIAYGTWGAITVSGMSHVPGTPVPTTWGTADVGDDLWQTFSWANSCDANVTVSGLNPAKTYQLEILNGDSRNPTPPWNMGVVVTDSSSNTLTGTSAWNNGEYALSTIVASNTTSLDYHLVYTAGLTQGAQFAGLVLREVPEPSAIILIGTAMFGLLAYAWRKRR